MTRRELVAVGYWLGLIAAVAIWSRLIDWLIWLPIGGR